MWRGAVAAAQPPPHSNVQIAKTRGMALNAHLVDAAARGLCRRASDLSCPIQTRLKFDPKVPHWFVNKHGEQGIANFNWTSLAATLRENVVTFVSSFFDA